MKYALSLFAFFISLNGIAAKIPDGQYQLVGVLCDDETLVRPSNKLKFKDFSFDMIQAKVPGRSSLAKYWWGLRFEKYANRLIFHWSQLHEGNARSDERNHTPFYASFTTQGRIVGNSIYNMHLLPSSLEIFYLEEHFNGQDFYPEDISGRLAKFKHVGNYSSQFTWKKITSPFNTQGEVYEYDEMDTGFGAPRHLLCGKVDAHMRFLLRAIHDDGLKQ